MHTHIYIYIYIQVYSGEDWKVLLTLLSKCGVALVKVPLVLAIVYLAWFRVDIPAWRLVMKTSISNHLKQTQEMSRLLRAKRVRNCTNEKHGGVVLCTDLSKCCGVERLAMFLYIAYVDAGGTRVIECIFCGFGGVAGKSMEVIAAEVVDRLCHQFGDFVLGHIIGWCGDNAAKTEILRVVAEIVKRGYI